MENPRPTFFVNSLENSTISLCLKNLRKIGHFKICFLSIYTGVPELARQPLTVNFNI
jgi:hypothetical protein